MKIAHFLTSAKLFLASGSSSSLQDASNQLGISGGSGSAADVGKSVISTVQSISMYVALITAVVALVMIGIVFIGGNKEKRLESMGKLPWIVGGLFVVASAVTIVSWIVTTIK